MYGPEDECADGQAGAARQQPAKLLERFVNGPEEYWQPETDTPQEVLDALEWSSPTPAAIRSSARAGSSNRRPSWHIRSAPH